MAGLHFWQTRGSSSLTKPCTTPPWLSAAVIKPRQPEPSNKKLTRYRSTAANFREVVSKGRHCADSSGRGEGLLLGWGKTPAFSLITENSSLLVDNLSKKAKQKKKCQRRSGVVVVAKPKKKKTPAPALYSEIFSNQKIQMRFFYPFNQ